MTLTLALLSMFFLDQHLTAFFMPDFLYRFRRVSRYLTDVGEGGPWVVFCFVLLISSSFVIRYKKQFRSLAIGLLCSLTAGAAILHLLKFLIGRQRPHLSENYDPLIFQPFSTNHHFNSMPSGHSQVLFAVAFNLALYFPKYRRSIYITAFLFAFTRVIVTQHFFSDVLAGCLTGYLGAALAHLLLQLSSRWHSCASQQSLSASNSEKSTRL